MRSKGRSLQSVEVGYKYYNTIPSIRTKKENIKFSLQAQNSIRPIYNFLAELGNCGVYNATALLSQSFSG